MLTLAIANQKGGVGKTTTVINMGWWFHKQGLRVLLVDLDGQGHVATGLNLEKRDDLYQWLVNGKPIKQITPTSPELGASVPLRFTSGIGEGGSRPLHLVRNDHTSELVKEHIRNANFREHLLKNALAEVAGDFDLCILDTPPSTDVLHILALVAADTLIIPALMDFYALDGINYELRTLRDLQRVPGVTPPELLGILPTRFERRTNETINNLAELAQKIGSSILLPPIPEDTKMREASAAGKPIWEYAPRARSAIGFEAMSESVNSLGRTGGYLHVCEVVDGMMKWER
mgnify:CR=1 FL=1